MEKIKLVVTDLDGTLLDQNQQISEEAVQTVAALAERDVRFTFITGRPYYAVERFARQLLITAPIVTCNGAVICDADRIFSCRSFALAHLERLVKAAVEGRFTVLMFQESVEYSFSETAWTLKRKQAGRVFPIKALSKVEWKKETAEKFNIIAGEESKGFNTLSELLQELKDVYSITVYPNTGCEIVAKDVNKAIGLQNLCEMLKIKVENVLAIGDNENDNEMLALAGVGAAVANAASATMAYADYKCKSSYTEGFVEAVHAVILNNSVGV